MLGKIQKKLIKKIKSSPFVYLMLAIILIAGFFMRVYRTEDLLGFYYDQGRDALKIWELWHHGNLMFIGPTTGLAGIFLGPFYYYLIAPFYLIDGGNPVYPAVFLAFLSTLSIGVLYYLGFLMHSRFAGLIAATLASFSYFLILAGRWLSNPTPIMFTSTLIMLSMWKIIDGENDRQYKNIWWMLLMGLIGISLHFESASAVFYLPIFLIFSFWQRKNLPDKKGLAMSAGIFIFTLLPQLAFNFKNENLLINNFVKTIIKEKSFNLSFGEVVHERLAFFKVVFGSKIFPGRDKLTQNFFIVMFFTLLALSKKFLKNKSFQLLLIFISVPLVGLILFQGNFGNIYDYYLTGYYLPFILLISLSLGEIGKSFIGKLLVILFMGLFLSINVTLTRKYLNQSIFRPTHVSLGNQLQAVNWVFEDAKNIDSFNIDVYVPPVIPYTYDYLFLWRGIKKCDSNLCGLEKEKDVPIVYTLYEVDPYHPDRIGVWFERQDTIGVVEKEQSFGGVTVQRRIRK